MAIYTMLTNVGLGKIPNAQSGMTIEITRWVGAFDESLYDDYQADNGLYENIANYTSTTDLYPNYPGETQATTYNGGITTNVNFVEGAKTQPDTVYWAIPPAPEDWATPKLENLYEGVTYSHVAVSNLDKLPKGDWGANTGSYPQNAVNGNWWNVTVAGTIYTTTPSGSAGVYYCVKDILAYVNGEFINTNRTRYRGNFNVRIQSDALLLINKIGLYAIVRDGLGAVIGDPFLLAQVIIPIEQAIQPKNPNTGVVDTIFLDFQIDAQAALIDFDNIVYASPNDYWKQVIATTESYGLQYDGNAYITQQLSVEDLTPNNDPNLTGTASTDLGVAKLLVSTFYTVNSSKPESERVLPQLVLQYVDNSNTAAPYIERRIRTTLRTTDDGDCEIDLYGACNNEFGYYSFVPADDELFGLGNPTNRWRWIEAANSIDLYNGAYKKGSDGKILKDGRWYYIEKNKPTSISTAENEKYNLYNYMNEMTEYGFISLTHNDISANTKLGMGYFGNSSIFVGPHYDSNDIVSGSSVLAHKQNYFYTYGNISNYINIVKETPTGGKEYPIIYPLQVRSTADLALYNLRPGHISRYEINSQGSTNWDADAISVYQELYNMILLGTDQNSANFYGNVTSVYPDAGVPPTIFDSFFDSDEKYHQLSNFGQDVWRDPVRYALYGVEQTGDPSVPAPLGLGADIMLASSRYIYTFGDIVPMVDGLNNIGSWLHNFGELHIDTIVGSDVYTTTTIDGVYTDTRHINIDGALLPVKTYHNLGSIENRWNILYAKQLGANIAGDQSDWIDTGYIKTVYSNTLNTNNIIVGGNLSVNNTTLISTNELVLDNRTTNMTSNYSIGNADAWIGSAYINTLYIGRIIGLDTSINTVMIPFALISNVTPGSSPWWSVNPGTFNATITYSVNGISSIDIVVVDSPYGEINTESQMADANDVSGSYHLMDSESIGVLTQLTKQMKLNTEIDMYVDDFWDLVFTNNVSIVTATGQQSVYDRSKSADLNVNYDKSVSFQDAKYDKTAKTFSSDYIQCTATHTNSNQAKASQKLYFNMAGIRYTY